MAAGEDRARPSGASGTRGGTRRRRRRFLLNERGTVEGAHRKSGRRAGPAAVSAAGPGRAAERGELGLGAGEGPGAWRGSRGSRGPWGPGIGAPASRRRVPAAARGPSASVAGKRTPCGWRGPCCPCGDQPSWVLVPELSLICVTLTLFLWASA